MCCLLTSSCGSAKKAFPQGSTTNYAVDDDPYVWHHATANEVNSYRTAEYENQWGLEAIHAAEAYAALEKNGKAVGGDGVMVAITDTGARITHQDIVANMNTALNRNFNVSPSTNDVNDTNGHGTHTMTTAVGVKNNTGIHGVAFNADTFAVKMIGLSTENGVEYSALHGAKVISMSWGYDFYDAACDGTTNCFGIFARDLAEFTVAKDHDVLMVAATGNDGYITPIFPAIYANNDSLAGYVLAVGAVEEDGFGSYTRASFSNDCGPAKDYCLVAPGVDIVAGYISSNTSYASFSGTSMATPHVSGAAAVLRGAWPFLTAVQTSQILLETATDLGASGVDDVYGHGMLNLFAAVQAQGTNNFNFGVRVSDGGYDLRSSSMITSPIFGDAIQNNVLPKLSSAVFFDKYGRDYKANLATKVGMNKANTSPNLNNIILNNISYQDIPLNFGGKSNLRFNVSDYKNSDAKNAVGLKYALMDNSIDYQQQAANNNGFAFTQNDVILPNSSFGFAFNTDEISNSQYRDFSGSGFMMKNNFAANPYQSFLQQSFGQDPQNSRKFNQFFVGQNFLDKKLGVNFSYQSSYESKTMLGNSGDKQNQILDLGLSFKGKNNSNFLLSAGSLREFDNNMLNSKSVGAFSAGNVVDTSYVKLTASKKLTKNLQLIASISEGISKINGNNYGIFREFSDVRSRSSSVAFIYDNFFDGKIGLAYIEPLRVYKGEVRFNIPVARDNAGNVMRYQDSASLVAQGKERDIEIFYSRLVGESSSLGINFILQKEPGNIRSAKDNRLGFVNYRKSF